MKLSELRGKPVIGMAGARKVGVVEDALVDSSHRKIEALIVKAERTGHEYVVSSEHIRAIGPDAVTIDSQDSLQTREQAPGLAGLTSLDSLIHSRIVTQGGQVLGTISEVDIDPTSREVQSFEYDGGALGGLLGRRRHTLDPKDVIGVGHGIVTVTEAARPSQAA